MVFVGLFKGLLGDTILGRSILGIGASPGFETCLVTWLCLPVLARFLASCHDDGAPFLAIVTTLAVCHSSATLVFLVALQFCLQGSLLVLGMFGVETIFLQKIHLFRFCYRLFVCNSCIGIRFNLRILIFCVSFIR